MFLSRLLHPEGRPAIILRQGREAALLKAAPDDPALFFGASTAGQGLLRHRLGAPVDVDDLAAQGRLALPVWGGLNLHLSPVAGELPLPLVQVCPGQPVPIGTGVTLEGGIAALMLPGGAWPSVAGWVQFHLVTCTGLGQRHLSFGPELVLGAEPPSGGGTGLLLAKDGTQRSFPLPVAKAWAPDAPPQDGTTGPDTLMLRRLSRWVIRPAAAQGLCALESRHLGAGLALTTPLHPASGAG